MTHIQNSNITVMVTNMDTAIKFYTETLGFKLKNRYGNNWADIEGPGIAIGLHPSGNEVIKGNNLSIGFKVKDLGQAIKAMEEKGVKFKIHDDTKVRLAFFTDPDSNDLYLAQSEW